MPFFPTTTTGKQQNSNQFSFIFLEINLIHFILLYSTRIEYNNDCTKKTIKTDPKNAIHLTNSIDIKMRTEIAVEYSR